MAAPTERRDRIRLVHLADTHLGFGAYRALDAEFAINQREADNYRAFERAIDAIMELRPDLVIHAGDVFDSARPSNRAMSFALRQFLRLTAAGIPVVLISGNHSTPKLAGTGSVFEIFDLFEGLRPVYADGYERVDLARTIVHAVPQCRSPEEFQAALAAARESLEQESAGKGNRRPHILTAHAAYAGIREFSMAEFNEQLISAEGVFAGFDYVALGHYHNHAQLAPNAYYSGSLEHLTFAEAGRPRGFLEVTLPAGTGNAHGTAEVVFREVATRAMVDLPPVDAAGADASSLMERLEKVVRDSAPEGAIVRLSLKDVEPAVYASLDFARLRALTADTVHFELNKQSARAPNDEAAPEHPETLGTGNLGQEFERFLAAQEKLPAKELRALRELGTGYLSRATASEEESG